MEETTKYYFIVGDWIVDPKRIRLISRNEKAGENFEKTLRPKEMDLLILLAKAAGEVVTVSDIHEKVWHNVAVSNDSIYFSLSQLRKALGDSTKTPQYIETIPKRGYRLICQVETVYESEAPNFTATQSSVNKPAPDLDQNATTKNNSGTSDSGVSQVPLAASFSHSDSSSNQIKSHVLKTWRKKAVFLFSLLLLIALSSYVYSSFNSKGDSSKANNEKMVTQPINAIAVLPFDDLSKNKDIGYLTNGLSTELIRQLGSVQGLRVAARTSAFSAKHLSLSATQIGKELKVGAVVEGNIQVNGNLLRVNVELVNTNNGFQIWSDSYQMSKDQLIELQDTIGQSILTELLPRLSDKSVQLHARVSNEVSSLAYEHYLKGLESIRTNTHQALRTAISDLSKAVEMAPNFSDALLALAHAKALLLETGASIDRNLLIESKQHVAQAQKLTPNNGNVYASLAKLAHLEKENEKCIDLYQTAIKLSPNDPIIKAQLATVLASTNRHQSERLFDEALKQDPFNDVIQLSKGFSHRRTGDNDKAIAAFERASQLNPKNPNYLWMKGYHQMLFMGKIQEGVSAIRKAIALDRQDPELQHFVDLGLLTLGAETSFHSKNVDFQNVILNGRINLGFEYAFDYLLESLYLMSQNAPDEAYSVAIGVFEKENMRFSHGAKGLLSKIVTDNMLKKKRYAKAENFLLEHGSNLKRILESSTTNNYEEIFAKQPNPHDIFSYLYLLKATNRIDEFNNIYDRFSKSRLLELSQARVKLMSVDYLAQAKLHALRDEREQALGALEEAVENGFRLNWQLEIEKNLLFEPISTEPRFKGVITEIKQDMLEQRNLMASNLSLSQ